MFQIAELPPTGDLFFFKKKKQANKQTKNKKQKQKRNKNKFSSRYSTDPDKVSVKFDHYFDYYFHGTSVSLLKLYVGKNRIKTMELTCTYTAIVQ